MIYIIFVLIIASFAANAYKWWPIDSVANIQIVKGYKETLLGHPLIFVQDKKNDIACFEDKCVHRGMPLSQSKNRIECAYHGWKYSLTDGRLLYEHVKHHGLKNQKCRLKKYPIEVRNNFVFVNLVDNTPFPESDEPPDISSRAIVKRDVDLPWKYIMTNNLDCSHLHYVHRNSIGRTPFSFDDICFDKKSMTITYRQKTGSVDEEEFGFRFLPPCTIYSWMKKSKGICFAQCARIIPLSPFRTRILYQQKMQSFPTVVPIVHAIVQEDVDTLFQQYQNHLKFSETKMDPNEMNEYDWNTVTAMDQLPYFWHNVWYQENKHTLPWFF